MTDKPEVGLTSAELADDLARYARHLRAAKKPAKNVVAVRLDEAARRLREMDGERIKGCEVVHASWNNYGCLELLIRLPQGPVGHEVKVADYTTLILNPPSPTAQKRTEHPVSSGGGRE